MLEIEGASAGYGDLDILRGVSLKIAKGEIVGLLGANNAGKSTLVNCISRIVPWRGGKCVFEGSDISRLHAHEVTERGISQVPEGRQLFPEMTVWENLALGAYTRKARLERSRKLEFVLDLFPRLSERRVQAAGTLSGGEQQMLAIGRALMSGPKLLILDEPSLGLSPKFVLTIFEALTAMHREGLTILLVEQNLNLTLQNVQRCYVLERGEIVISGRSEDMQDDPAVKRAYLGT
ncbi:MAG: ABC transporter ATP-binding protein [Bradyrhizobium sp.]|jgi:branched-chain amino acid transport system ATP-binding protein|uniref:ABC transporter ATP-binding protein n=1 Tax=Bradyrhizobium TaxID=374 RepID=UPI0003FD8D31|nr:MULTISPECIES: ABC transporter ATP-binding protein [Bradyrhizobium]MBJ7404152.1 ABC transporter ATP-binding protein [Bradyrhizobium sp.]